MALPVQVKKPSWVDDFVAFIARGNVVDLAVGVIIGAAFGAIVASLVKDIFNPVIGLALGGVDFSNLFLTLKGPATPTLEAAKAAGAVTINYGIFLNAVIQFLIVAFAVFWMVKMLSKVMRKKPVEEPSPVTPREQVLLEEIRDLLARQSLPAPRI